MTELLISENYYAEQFDWHTRAVESFVMDWVQAKEWDETFKTELSFYLSTLRSNGLSSLLNF